jgi:hypothetical protein
LHDSLSAGFGDSVDNLDGGNGLGLKVYPARHISEESVTNALKSHKKSAIALELILADLK